MKFLNIFNNDNSKETIENGNDYRDMVVDAENSDDLMMVTNDSNQVVKPKGLIAEGEVGIFMNEHDKYFHFGKKNGQLYGSVDSLENAKKDIVAVFQRIISQCIVAREDKVAQMNMHIEAFPPNENQLKPKMNVLTLEINKLKEQIELSGKFEGWVKSNVTAYENGFTQGKNETLERLF